MSVRAVTYKLPEAVGRPTGKLLATEELPESIPLLIRHSKDKGAF